LPGTAGRRVGRPGALQRRAGGAEAGRWSGRSGGDVREGGVGAGGSARGAASGSGVREGREAATGGGPGGVNAAAASGRGQSGRTRDEQAAR
jgi:hypothetical protein